MKTLLPFVISAVLLVGCTSNSKQNSVKESDLLHHNFILASVDCTAIKNSTKDPRPLNLEFGENMHISGAMCNNFMGKATLKDNVLTTNPLASTRMACLDEQKNRLDRVIANVLNKGAKVDLDQSSLTLTTPEHTLVYNLKDWIN